MKKTFLFTILFTVFALAACTDSQQQLSRRAALLCQYVPDHQLKEQSQDYMTKDFYTLLDTMFNHLPEYEEVAHEWIYYFVTGNGGTIADFEVKQVEKTDDTHALATILVRQKWEDGSFDPTTDIEEHRLYMEKMDGEWLMSDFDEHKQDCIRYIAICRQEQAVRDAISDYLTNYIGSQYLQGEVCIPTIIIVAAEELSPSDDDSTMTADSAVIFGDFWIDWFNISGDTLYLVSGGNHSGRMTLVQHNEKPQVTAFEQTVDGAGNTESAMRIFGEHYDVYHNIHSNQDVREACRKLQIIDYVRRKHMNIHYYQDFGREAVEL